MLKLISGWLRATANYLNPLPEKNYTLIATITDDNNVDYTLTKDLSPELLAKLIVRMAIMTDGAQFINKLAENGYVDAYYRLQLTSNRALSSIFDAATRPEESNEAITEKPVEKKDDVEHTERPVIEALVG